jgi:ribonucleotide reductase alpha subunit
MISKSAGGVCVAVSNVRFEVTYRRGTNGSSNGLVLILRCFTETARCVDQCGGKRNGSFAVNLEPERGDIFDSPEQLPALGAALAHRAGLGDEVPGGAGVGVLPAREDEDLLIFRFYVRERSRIAHRRLMVLQASSASTELPGAFGRRRGNAWLHVLCAAGPAPVQVSESVCSGSGPQVDSA